MKLSEKYNLYTILLLILTMIAFLIRVYHIDYLTLWVDEYVHVDRARYFPNFPLFTDDNNGILLTLILIPLFKLFGVNEFVARFPSVIFGTGLVPLIYFLVKKFFNKNTAIISAALVTFSTYLVFWSRISRNYAIFVFFFILFLYYLGIAINVDNCLKEQKNRFWNYFKIQPKYLLITLVVLAFSIISHLLTYLVIYGILFYYLTLFINNLFHKKYNFLSFEAVVSYLFVAFIIIIFIPFFQSLLLNILPVQISNWGGLPDFARLYELIKTDPFNAFSTYFNVLKYDYHLLSWLGFAGFICAIVRYRKAGFFITSIFIAAFVLMSFVFREPSTARYLIFIYPLFLIAIALSLDTVIILIRKIKIVNRIHFINVGIVAVVLICFFPTSRNTLTMVTSKEHGYVISRFLDASFYFPDWKSSLKRIKLRLKKEDVLLSTVPAYVDFYIGRKPYWFRQRMYDAHLHGYVDYPIDTLHTNAFSTQAVSKLLDNTDTAWLIADYYFNNTMTNPETRNYVANRMKFEYDMSNQYVSVFSYDKTKPNSEHNSVFEYIHSENPVSLKYEFPKPSNEVALMLIEIEGIQYDNEAVIQFNDKDSILVLKENGILYNENGDSRSRQFFALTVPQNLLKEETNTFKVKLNTNIKYKKCRYVLYNYEIPDYTINDKGEIINLLGSPKTY